jgi:hypothetical protein
VTLGQQVAQLLVAIRAELQHADSKRAEEMGLKVDKLILCVFLTPVFASTYHGAV